MERYISAPSPLVNKMTTTQTIWVPVLNDSSFGIRRTSTSEYKTRISQPKNAARMKSNPTRDASAVVAETGTRLA